MDADADADADAGVAADAACWACCTLSLVMDTPSTSLGT
jgi:hypothetical protein